MTFSGKSLLGTQGLSKEEILSILDTADSFKEISSRPIKKVPTLRGRTIVNMFFEPSTRTRASFEIAGKRLSADVINISGNLTSSVKGESLIDTVRNLEAMSTDILILRHHCSGAAHFVARHLNAPIINAGDGTHEHPTQALLDLFTIREHKKKLKGLCVTIIGDITHSRVARSNIFAMNTLGMKVTVAGPPTMIPLEIEKMGVRVCYDLKDALRDADVIMTLRIQLERQSQFLFPSLREFSNLYGLTLDKLNKAAPDAIIIHPGPVNNGVEIAPEVQNGPRSLILNQVSNGVAVRMALMYLVTGSNDENPN